MAPIPQFKQAVAVIRHGERLDRTPSWEAWEANSDTTSLHDPPLSDDGKTRSRARGQTLRLLTPSDAAPYELIISAPDLRCAQTASELANELSVPVCFDEDLGEVTGEVSSVRSRWAHRTPHELREALESEYPDVQYAVDMSGQMQVRGVTRSKPESLLASRTRFCCKAELIAATAARRMMSVIIVSHDSAVAGIAHHMSVKLCLGHIPPNGFFVATRSVTPSNAFLETGDALWTVQLSEDIGRVPQVVERRQVDLAMMREQCRSLHCNEFDKDAVEFRICEAMSRNEQNVFESSAGDIPVMKRLAAPIAKTLHRLEMIGRVSLSRESNKCRRIPSVASTVCGN